MENIRFDYTTVKTGRRHAYSLKYIPTMVMVVWAAFIVFLFASKGSFLWMLLFLACFCGVMAVFWSKIWHPYLEFNAEKKRLEFRLDYSVYAIDSVDIEKIITITKDTKFCVGPKESLFGIALGTTIYAILGAISGLIFGLLIFGGPILGPLGGALLGALSGLGDCYVLPGNYTLYDLKIPQEQTDSAGEKNKNSTKKTFSKLLGKNVPVKSKNQDSSEKNSSEEVQNNTVSSQSENPAKTAVDSEKKDGEKVENVPISYFIDIEKEENGTLFEEFLQQCYKACGRDDFKIEEIG